MGVLSFRLKSSFLDLLKILNSLNWLIVLFSLFNLSVCIYEDQIGKFDWRQTYVGRIKLAQYDTTSTAKKIIVATEENVLAALNLKTGEVIWRHVLESASRGNIQMLHVSEKSGSAITVTGTTSPYVVRKWNTNTGVLLWAVAISVNSPNPELARFWMEDDHLVQLAPVYGSHIELTFYNVMKETDGKKMGIQRISAPWNNEGCIVSGTHYICISEKQIFGLNIKKIMNRQVNAENPIVQAWSNYVKSIDGGLRPLIGSSKVTGFIIDDKKAVIIVDDEFKLLPVMVEEAGSIFAADTTSETVLIQVWNDDITGLTMNGFGLTSLKDLKEYWLTTMRMDRPQVELLWATCAGTACRLLITAGDDSLTLMQGDTVLWSREEALANVVAAEFVDLPVSDLDAAIESEFDQKEGSIWSAFSRRLETQAQQLQSLVTSWTTPDAQRPADGASHLHRDYFNLHKIIVLLTECGKIFGMDNLSGEILWRRYEASLDSSAALMFLRRSARHPPHDALLTILGKHEETGNGLLINLNPINGASIGEGLVHLDNQLLQAAMLPTPDQNKLHALILLDKDENVHVFPPTAAHLVKNLFIYVAETNTATVQGYALQYDGESVVARKTWSLRLAGGSGGEARIVSAAGSSDAVHSGGRVLGDRSVLYKYINPNLVLFLTEYDHPVHKETLVASVVDVVSGGVAAAQTHRRARPVPAPALHSEHLLCYAYYNDKLRRTEIATMELYEGPSRWQAAGAGFSSLSAASARAPATPRQAYIVPADLLAAAFTRTERSLTDKHVLLALSSGAVVEMPWSFLEPRRPAAPTPEQREEGLLPYAPELPLAADAVINYNRSVARVRSLYTAPAGLESTCLVLVTGLDLFYTRVAPSKTFDLLKDDFDYYLITIVLAALIVASHSTKYFASRKMLRQAWK